jgi:hypothetical protein
MDEDQFWSPDEQTKARDYDQILYWWLRGSADDYTLQENPVAIDGEFQDEFFDRWKRRLAEATVFGLDPETMSGPAKGMGPFRPSPAPTPIDPQFLPHATYGITTNAVKA